MRRGYAYILAAGALALTAVLAAASVSYPADELSGLNCTPNPAGQVRHLARATYAPHRWRHRHPLGDATAAAIDTQLGCLAPATRGVIANEVRDRKDDFFDYRRYRRVAPFHCGFSAGPLGGRPRPGDGDFYAIPCNVVCGESGGQFRPWGNAADGAYQLLPSTWLDHGGGKFAAVAGAGTPLEQHIVARRAWLAHTTWYGNKSGCR